MSTGRTRSTRPPATRQLRAITMQVGVVAALLLIWQFAALIQRTPTLPPFTDVLTSYLQILFGERLITDVLPSVLRVVAGFLAGIALGGLLGLAIGFARPLEPWVRPVLEFLRAIPVVALLPVALLLFGATEQMRIGLIAFGSAFPVLLAAIDGTRRVEPLYLDAARISGRRGIGALMRVALPAALPQIMAGVRIALGLALIVMVISELTAATNGIGYYIQQSQRLFRTVDVYAGTLVIGTLGIIFTALILAVERWVLRWHRGWRGAADS